jgi:hypothetical protein
MKTASPKKARLLFLLPALLLIIAVAFGAFGCFGPAPYDPPEGTSSSKTPPPNDPRQSTSSSTTDGSLENTGEISLPVSFSIDGDAFTATFAGDYMYAGFGFTNSTPIYINSENKVSAHDKQDFNPQLGDGRHEVCTDEYTLDGTLDSTTGQITATIKYHHEGDIMSASGGIEQHIVKDYQGTLTASKVGEMAWEGTVTGTEDGRTLNWTVKISKQ